MIGMKYCSIDELDVAENKISVCLFDFFRLNKVTDELLSPSKSSSFVKLFVGDIHKPRSGMTARNGVRC